MFVLSKDYDDDDADAEEDDENGDCEGAIERMGRMRRGGECSLRMRTCTQRISAQNVDASGTLNFGALLNLGAVGIVGK